MPRPSSRPVSTRVQSRSVGTSTKTAKPKRELPPLNLPDDEDDFKPAKRGKKRSKEDTIKSTAKKREKIEEFNELEEAAAKFIEDMEDVEGEGKAKKMISTFQKGFEKTRQAMTDGSDMPVEQTSASFYRNSLAMVMDLIPIAEHNYRSTGKEGANYALQALVNQGRDLMSDVKLSEDVESKLVVVKQLVRASFMRVADLLIREKYDYHRAIDGITTDARIRKAARAEIDKTVMSFGKGMTEFQGLLTTQLSMFLMGDPGYLNPQSGESSEMDGPAKKKRGRKKKK